MRYGFKVEFHNSKDTLLVIKDLKTIIKQGVYRDHSNIDSGIETINYILAKKIHDINNNITNKNKKSIDDQLFLHNLMKKI